MTEREFEDRWTEERTTFQRVYDVILGTESWVPAVEIADQCACSETGAREALSEWRTVRRDVRVLRRAVDRAETRSRDGARA